MARAVAASSIYLGGVTAHTGDAKVEVEAIALGSPAVAQLARMRLGMVMACSSWLHLAHMWLCIV